MTIYLDALGEEITAERAREYAEARLGRSLTDGEKALDLVGLDLDLREGKEALTAAIEEERRRAVEDVLRGGAGRLRVTPEMIAAMTALVEAGRRHAREEIDRLGLGDLRREFAEADEPGLVTRLVEELIRMLTAIRVRVNNEAGAIDFGGGGPITEELIDKLDRRVPGARDAASRLVSGLLIGGLGEVYEHNADLFPCFIYSAVMDGATCEVCRSFDGTRYSSWIMGERDLPSGGPNPRCLGDGRCRCRLVPCPPGEVVEDVLGPEPPEPEVAPEIAAIRAAIADFEGISDEEFEDAMSADINRRYDSTLYGRSGYASPDLLRREEQIRVVGRMIEDEADRRFSIGEEERDRAGIEATNRVEEHRAELQEAINRHQETVERVRDRIEREMFGDRGADSGVKYDLLVRAYEEDPEVVASRKRVDEIQEEHYRLAAERDRLIDPFRIHAEKRREVLDEIVGLGEGERFERREPVPERLRSEWDAKGYSDLDDEALYEMLDDQARWLPRDWIAASNERGGVRVARRSRAHYADKTGMVSTSGWTEDDQRETFTHELGHRMESTLAEVRIWEWAYHYRRIRDSHSRRERLVDLEPGSGYEDYETTYADEFADPYSGRDYGFESDSSYEILSMGLQGLFWDPARIDDDHRDFTLGLLATVRPKRGRIANVRGVVTPG